VYFFGESILNFDSLIGIPPFAEFVCPDDMTVEAVLIPANGLEIPFFVRQGSENGLPDRVTFRNGY
jgi:hypothetical protein